MKHAIQISVMLLLTGSLRSQDSIHFKYNLLVGEAVFSRAFIKIKPLSLTSFSLIGKRAFERIDKDTMETPGLSEIEMALYRNLVFNTSFLDTNSWQDSELSNCVIVPASGRISKKYALSKLKPNTEKDRIFFNKLIFLFNRSGGKKKWLYTFSRPVFDSSRNYAVIADASSGNNFGCFFYKWNGNKWKEMFSISTRE